MELSRKGCGFSSQRFICYGQHFLQIMRRQMRLCKVFSSLITSKMWNGGPHSAEGPGPLLCYSGFTSICLLLVQALLAFAVADEVLKAGLNAWDRFYLGLGLRGNLLGLGWAVCPLRTGQQDAGVQQ